MHNDLPHLIHWHDNLFVVAGDPIFGWALNTRPVVDLRKEPNHDSERVTQVLFGEVVEIVMEQDAWSLVRLGDGYQGWMLSAPLQRCSADAALNFVRQRRHIVKQRFAPCYASPDDKPRNQSALLAFGMSVISDGRHGSMERIKWPDGSQRWIPSASLYAIEEIPRCCLAGLEMVTSWLPQLIGVPYLWGGKTAFGYDCSGLVQVLFSLIDVQLQRDARQQSIQGRSVSFSEVSFGDLLFFDADTRDDECQSTSYNVTHVALALGGDAYVHASCGFGGVVWGSFNPASSGWSPIYERSLVRVCRYIDS